ncbi:outer membrane efflux protein [Nitrospira sp.]|nr:outer membrane efflux protein [Nitrospira sp.]
MIEGSIFKRLGPCVFVILSLVGFAPCATARAANGSAPEPVSPAVDPSDHMPAPGRFLGVQQAVEAAIKHHPALHVAMANQRAAEARTGQARSLYYPQIYADFVAAGGAAGVNPRFVSPAGALLRPNLGQYVGGVIANQRLYDFGYTNAIVESADLAASAQIQNFEAQQSLVVYAVQRAYFDSLKRRQLVEIAEETIKQRGVIKSQVETLYRQQLKSKLDLNLVQVELTNAESALVRARNNLKASFAELNRAMGLPGENEYILEDVIVEVDQPAGLPSLIQQSLTHPELKRAREQARSAEAKLTASKKQYLPTISAVGSAGDYQLFDRDPSQRTGGWWAASATVSFPLFTGGLIDGQIREAMAQLTAAQAQASAIEQTLTQQVTNAYLDTVTFIQQIKLAKEQVQTAMEALHLSQQRYKLGLGSIVEVTQSEVALTAAETRLAEAQFDYKIADLTLAYSAGIMTAPSTSEAALPPRLN